MAKRGPTNDPEVVATVLADAATSSVKAAAARHGISERTVKRWRAKYGDDPIVSPRVQTKKEVITDGWIEEVKRVRMKGLLRMEALIETSEDLRDVTGAMKIMNDAVLAERVVDDGLGLGSSGTSGASQAPPEAPSRPLTLYSGGKV